MTSELRTGIIQNVPAAPWVARAFIVSACSSLAPCCASIYFSMLCITPAHSNASCQRKLLKYSHHDGHHT